MRSMKSNSGVALIEERLSAQDLKEAWVLIGIVWGWRNGIVDPRIEEE